MSATWNTKYGMRRVRHDPPTLAEAIEAAQGLTDDVEGQIAIAADLMGAAREDVKSEMRKLVPDRRITRLVAANSRDNGVRTVVVEKKASRRVIARADMTRSDLIRSEMADFAHSDAPRAISKITLTRASLARHS